jgi:hypothetical protein
MQQTKQEVILRIMQVRPWGQKKPGQQDWHLSGLYGMSLVFCRSIFWSGPALHAQPGSHPSIQDDRLQFTLGFT